MNNAVNRHQWSKLNPLQLGRYAEYCAKMRLVEAGWEVYSAEVDDRGIDFLVRIGPGRCLEIQVKSVRPGKAGTYVYFTKKGLGDTKAQIAQRLAAGYVLCVLLFQDGREPGMYLIPGTIWLTPNTMFADRDYEGRKSKPEFGLTVSDKYMSALAPYLFTNQSADQIADHFSSSPAGKAQA